MKAGLAGIETALKTAMKHGGRILVMSSGAATVMSVPHFAPEDLRLSGGYIGAKRRFWFMAHSANVLSRTRARASFSGVRTEQTGAGYRTESSGRIRPRGD